MKKQIQGNEVTCLILYNPKIEETKFKLGLRILSHVFSH